MTKHDILKQFGIKLKACRNELNLTISSVSNNSGINSAVICKLENGNSNSLYAYLVLQNYYQELTNKTR